MKGKKQNVSKSCEVNLIVNRRDGKNEKIRVYRKNERFFIHKTTRKKLTQKEIAKEIGISRTYYAFIEKGKRDPSPKIAKKIAKLFNLDWTLFYND